MLTPSRPLRVAVLCSHRAPGLAHLLERDPNRGHAYDVVCVLTSESVFAGQDIVRGRGPDIIWHPIAAFYGDRPRSILRDRETRRSYDRETLDRLTPYSPDLVLLDGYLYLVTEPLLEAFPRRMINLHFSDLTIRHADGRPAFVGRRAVRDALVAGQKDTAATLHLVNEVPDGGAPIVRSWPHAVSPMVAYARRWHADDMLKAYVFAHQEWMIRSASGPVLAAGLTLVAGKTVDLDLLGAGNPAKVAPWLVDERGRLLPPDGRHISERLWAYERATA